MTRQIFVATPYGIEEGIDFRAIYTRLIQPALGLGRFTAYHVDTELRGTDIPDEILQNLLSADIVIVDLTIDDASVWYMLGVRHALRARGVVRISGGQQAASPDAVHAQTLRYRLRDGVPDPLLVHEDIASLARLVQNASSLSSVNFTSPVYERLPRLVEPRSDLLRVGGVHELWPNETQWTKSVADARRERKPGNLMLLAEEAPVRAVRCDAYREAAICLRRLGREQVALEQIDLACILDPADWQSQQEKGLLLARLGRFDEAKALLHWIVREQPDASRTYSLLARIEKYRWINAWRIEGPDLARKNLAAATIGLLDEAIQAHITALAHDGTNVHCAMDAATLCRIRPHLAGYLEHSGAKALDELKAEAHWAARVALSVRTEGSDAFRVRVSRAELYVLADDAEAAASAYRNAVAATDTDWYLLDSARKRLTLLEDLDVCSACVHTALDVVNRALESIEPPPRARLVVLFAGHMIDTLERKEKRFPSCMTRLAEAAIEDALDELGTGPGDLALCEGACGGDLLFATAALKRNMNLELRLPFDEASFLECSVAFAGPEWKDAYFDVKANPRTRIFCMPNELGPTPPSIDTFERVNLWQIHAAYAMGPQAVRVVVLWDGKDSGKPGGTPHMVATASRRFGEVRVIDTQRMLRQIA